MQPDIQTSVHAAPSGTTERPSRRAAKRSAVPYILLMWAILIGGGIYGSVWYTNALKEQMTADIERQTALQITAMQADYDARIEALELEMLAEIDGVAVKVDALNELLTFTKDNANSKTDNSNQLYTQINEVKKKLNELQKSLDVLK